MTLPDLSFVENAELPRPSGITEDASYYYFFESDSGEFRRMAKGDVAKSAGTPIGRWTELASRHAHASFVRGAFVYFVLGADPSSTMSAIVRVPLCGGAPLVIARPYVSASVVVEGTDVVWIAGNRILHTPL